MNSTNTPPYVGDSVTFTCGQVSQATSYEFRVIVNGNITAVPATGRTSVPYTVNSTEEHFAQCRICVGNACQEWEPVPGSGGNTGPQPVGTPPSSAAPTASPSIRGGSASPVVEPIPTLTPRGGNTGGSR